MSELSEEVSRRTRAQQLGFSPNAQGEFLICRNHNCWGDTDDACGRCDANIVSDALIEQELADV